MIMSRAWILAVLLAVPAAVPAATLLHHWPLDDGSGTVAADVVGSAPMTLSGSTAGWTASGRVGGAYQFNGASYFVTPAADTLTDPGAAVAIAGWFRSSPSTDNRDFLYEFERIHGMRIQGDGLQVSFNDNTSGAPTWGAGLDDGEWHHFVAQNTNGTTTLYVDGAWAGSRSETLASLTSVSRDSAIGARQAGTRLFAGWIDDVRIYSGGLTEAEIRILAQVVNQPPVAENDAYAGTFNQTLTVAPPGVLANDLEVDGDPLTAVLVSNVALGGLTFSTNGSFSYIPPTDFFGQVAFAYKAVDKDGESAPATVTLTLLDPSTTLTTAEVAMIEGDLGITLTETQKIDLAAIVKSPPASAWRTDAQNRIHQHRKADLTVQVVDTLGNPVPGATVRVELLNHAFRFGGVATVMDLTDAEGSLAAAGSTTGQWENLVLALFNAVGLNNALKPKITGQHTYLPGFMAWAASHQLPVRGHLLMWPGGGGVDDLDDPLAVSGIDYGDHLSTASTSAYASHNVLGAVDTYKASPRSPADKAALKAEVDAEIAEWASTWNVYEWDVINETIGNTLLQEILGYGEMATWFELAASNRVDPDCNLFINDFQLMSARFDDGDSLYEARRDTYFERIDLLLSNSAPVTGIGFQSRFRFGENPPDLVYDRLQDFALRYPDLDFTGTEFEIKDRYSTTGDPLFLYDETTRARMTEEYMTVYFSHPQVTGLFAWDFINDYPDSSPGADDNARTTQRSLVYYGDGPGGVEGPEVKLNGLVWHYLHRIRYHTDVSGLTASNGSLTVQSYKGDVALTVRYDGMEIPATVTLLSNRTIQVALSGITLPPTQAVLDEWWFDDVNATPITEATNRTGTTSFTGASPGVATDGGGRLVIQQHPSAVNPGSGVFLNSGPLTFGSRTGGVYELDWTIVSASLESGDPNGATVGFGLKDSGANADLFRIRLNKTVGGLAVSTFIDGQYTAISNFTGVFTLPAPLRLRSVIDLEADVADVYLTLGGDPERFMQQVALSTNGSRWDQSTFLAVNNATDWGAADTLVIEAVTYRKVQIETYADWADALDWQGESARGETDDPDGDGTLNLMEFAIGGNPVISDAHLTALRCSLDNLQPSLVLTPAIDTLDLPFVLDFTDDFIRWDQIPSLRLYGEAGQPLSIPWPPETGSTQAARLRVGFGN